LKHLAVVQINRKTFNNLKLRYLHGIIRAIGGG
jgi:hypothetical protein